MRRRRLGLLDSREHGFGGNLVSRGSLVAPRPPVPEVGWSSVNNQLRKEVAVGTILLIMLVLMLLGLVTLFS